MKIRYELDLADPEYSQLAGGTDLPGALPILLRDSGLLRGGTGYVYRDTDADETLCIAASDDLGLFLGITADGKEWLSCGDPDDLTETVEVWGDDLLISRGLFIPTKTALAAARYFAETGKPDPAVKWISPEELPEEGNFII